MSFCSAETVLAINGNCIFKGKDYHAYDVSVSQYINGNRILKGKDYHAYDVSVSQYMKSDQFFCLV